jgi:hypothetical protein
MLLWVTGDRRNGSPGDSGDASVLGLFSTETGLLFYMQLTLVGLNFLKMQGRNSYCSDILFFLGQDLGEELDRKNRKNRHAAHGVEILCTSAPGGPWRGPWARGEVGSLTTNKPLFYLRCPKSLDDSRIWMILLSGVEYSRQTADFEYSRIKRLSRRHPPPTHTHL